MRRLSGSERLRMAALGATLALAALAGCAGSDMQVETEYDETHDFSSLKTFGYQTGFFSMPDGRDLDSAAVERIEIAVVGELEGKGFEHVQTEDIDFVAIVRGGRLQSTVTKYNENVYVPQSDWIGNEDTYDEGALLIELRLPGGSDPIWRGVGKVRLEHAPANQEHFDKWVAKILKDFPPK